MATEWHQALQSQLDDFIEKLKDRFQRQSISIVESLGFVPGAGAFVSIGSRSDAEELFLSEVVIILCRNQLETYEASLAGEFSQACFVSAESKTADIEKKLVSGVHGPKECIFVEVQ